MFYSNSVIRHTKLLNAYSMALRRSSFDVIEGTINSRANVVHLLLIMFGTFKTFFS